jgi:GT2 family glycosyltransferase
MKVAIVIASYNRLDMLEQCLAAIRQNTWHPYELVLVDNGSDEETRTFIEAQRGKKDVRSLLRLPRNEGFARGYGAGLALAGGGYRVVLNNDTVPSSGWLSKMAKVFVARPGAGLVVPYTNYTGADATLCKGKDIVPIDTKMVKGDLPAICWLVSRKCHDAVCEVIEELGGGRHFFHASFDYGFAEDIVTSIAIEKLGFEKYVAGGSFVYHHGAATQSILGDVGDYRAENRKKLKWCKKRLGEMDFWALKEKQK